jgi:hypothetical protein
MTVYLEEYKLLFVHIPKNGGTSVRRALLSASGFPGIPPCVAAHIYKQREGRVFSGHMPAQKCRSLLGAEKYDSITIFAICRNPWERLASFYHYSKMHKANVYYKIASKLSFTDFTNTICQAKILGVGPEWSKQIYAFMQQGDYISGDQGQSLVSYIARYENLLMDLKKIDHYLLRRIHSLPWLNRSSQPGEHKQYYNNKLTDLVGTAFNRDVRMFNYKPW